MGRGALASERSKRRESEKQRGRGCNFEMGEGCDISAAHQKDQKENDKAGGKLVRGDFSVLVLGICNHLLSL